MYYFPEYMTPLLTQLSVLTDFTVKSQWLYFVTLDVQPKLVPQKGPIMQHYALSEDILPHLITPLEKKLGTERDFYHKYIFFQNDKLHSN